MADYTDEQLKELRRMIGDDTLPYLYSDSDLAQYLDDNDGDFTVAAGKMWREKAATYAKSVDISEAGSSRKMSDLFDNALAMAKWYEDQTTPPVVETVASSTTRRIVRR